MRPDTVVIDETILTWSILGLPGWVVLDETRGSALLACWARHAGNGTLFPMLVERISLASNGRVSLEGRRPIRDRESYPEGHERHDMVQGGHPEVAFIHQVVELGRRDDLLWNLDAWGGRAGRLATLEEHQAWKAAQHG